MNKDLSPLLLLQRQTQPVQHAQPLLPYPAVCWDEGLPLNSTYVTQGSYRAHSSGDISDGLHHTYKGLGISFCALHPQCNTANNPSIPWLAALALKAACPTWVTSDPCHLCLNDLCGSRSIFPLTHSIKHPKKRRIAAHRSKIYRSGNLVHVLKIEQGWFYFKDVNPAHCATISWYLEKHNCTKGSRRTTSVKDAPKQPASSS